MALDRFFMDLNLLLMRIMNNCFRRFPTLLLFVAGLMLSIPATAQRQADRLDRGVVAIVKSSSQVFVSWRLLATDPEGIGFNVYRCVDGGEPRKLNQDVVSGATNALYTVSSLDKASVVYVCPVIDGVEQTVPDGPVTVSELKFKALDGRTLGQPGYLPAGSWVLEAGKAANRLVRDFDYAPLPAGYPKMMMKFCWVGDLDGDGRLDYVIDRQGGGTVNEEGEEVTSGSKVPGQVEAYTADGQFLWRLSVGPNITICSGHNDMVTVFDMDGDGRCEVMVAVSEGAVFADGTKVLNADGTVYDYTSSVGSAPQWVAVVDGRDGHFITKTELPHFNDIATQRSDSQWKNVGGHFIINYLDGIHPSLVYQYKNRQTSGLFTGAFAAWRLIDSQLVVQYATLFDRNDVEYESHQVRAADVDGDGKDEFVEISYVIDDDGSHLCRAPGIEHGDRHCLADIDPDRPGLEQFFIQQTNIIGMGLWDACTGEIIKANYLGAVGDVGRGVCAALDPNRRGMQYFSTMNNNQVYDCHGDEIAGATGMFPAEMLWWGPEMSRYMVSPIGSSGYNIAFNRFNAKTQSMERVTPNFYLEGGDYYLQAFYAGRPAFWGDILGDWREEMVLARRDTTGFAVVSTWDQTDHRQYCLFQDPGYRLQTTARGYYQSPDVDFYMAADMPEPPVPAVQLAEVYLTEENTLTSALDGRSAMLDIRNANATLSLEGPMSPSVLWLMNPKGHDYVLQPTAEKDSLVGSTEIVKSMQGKVLFKGNHSFDGGVRVSEGAFFIEGNLASAVRVDARGVLGGTGRLGGGVVLENGLNRYGGRLEPGQEQQPGQLEIAGDLRLPGRNTLAFDLDQTQTAKNDLLVIDGSLLVSGGNHALAFNVLTSLQPDTLELIRFDSTNVTAGTFALSGLEGVPVQLLVEKNCLKLVVKETRNAACVQWNGQNGQSWDYQTQNFLLDGQPDIFVPGDTVHFSDEAVQKTLTLSETLPVGGLTFENTQDYVLSGSGALSGEASLKKTGAGKLSLLNTANTFTGGIDFSDGTLVVAALATGGQPSSIGAAPGDAKYWIMRNATLQSASQLATDRNMSVYGTLTINNASGKSLALTGNLSGSQNKLVLTGGGSLNLEGSNRFDTVEIRQGTLSLGSVSANSQSIGSAVLVLRGGTFQMRDANSTSTVGPWSNTVVVPEGCTASWNLPKRWNFTNKLLGKGTLNLNSPYVRAELKGDWSGFEGTINVTGQDFRLANTYGMAKATVDLGAGVTAYHTTKGSTVKFGALSSTATDAALSGDNAVWEIGANGRSTTYAGTVSGASAKLIKKGSGTLTLSGTGTNTGATEVQAGKLWITGNGPTGTGTLSVKAGATAGGTGSVKGNVTVVDGAVFSLKNDAFGSFGIAGSLTLQAGSVLEVDVSSLTGKCDVLNIGKNLTAGGTLRLNNLSQTVSEGRSFRLMNISGSVDGQFDSIVPVLENGLYWDFADGVLTARAVDALSAPAVCRSIRSITYYNLLGEVLYVSEGADEESLQLGWQASGNEIILRRTVYTDGTVCTEKLSR